MCTEFGPNCVCWVGFEKDSTHSLPGIEEYMLPQVNVSALETDTSVVGACAGAGH